MIEVVSMAPRSPARKTLKRKPGIGLKKRKPAAKRRTAGSAKKPKKKKFSIRKADNRFSAFIRERDGKCMYPGCEVRDFGKLQCSHYHGRGKGSTRFDPDNCIALCWFHHFKDKMLGWEYQKQTVEDHGWDGRYTLFMREWLGKERFDALKVRAAQTKNRRKAFEEWLETAEAAQLR